MGVDQKELESSELFSINGLPSQETLNTDDSWRTTDSEWRSAPLLCCPPGGWVPSDHCGWYRAYPRARAGGGGLIWRTHPPQAKPPGQRHGQQPVSGTADPGVVEQDKSSGGSVDTTKTRSDPQRVRMCSGERPIGAAKGKQPKTEALCQGPPRPGGQTLSTAPGAGNRLTRQGYFSAVRSLRMARGVPWNSSWSTLSPQRVLPRAAQCHALPWHGRGALGHQCPHTPTLPSPHGHPKPQRRRARRRAQRDNR